MQKQRRKPPKQGKILRFFLPESNIDMLKLSLLIKKKVCTNLLNLLLTHANNEN